MSQLCSALKFPRSTYYKALICVPSNKRQEYEEFSRKVKQVYQDSKQRYGVVKICHIVNDNGTPCSVKRVQRHMAEQGLCSVVVKKYNHHGSVPDDIFLVCAHIGISVWQREHNCQSKFFSMCIIGCSSSVFFCQTSNIFKAITMLALFIFSSQELLRILF